MDNQPTYNEPVQQDPAMPVTAAMWMKVNGEGIYGTGPWKVFGEGEVNNVAGSFMDNDEKEFTSSDYRFTYKDGYLYAFCMKPSCADYCIKSLKDHLTRFQKATRTLSRE